MTSEPLRYGSTAMVRRALLVLLGVVSLVFAPAAAAPAANATTPAQSKESSNPINDQGSSYEYRSNITAVAPNVGGLSVEVLEFADRLLLRNHTGKTVTIYGYEGEPYARVLANGTAEQNVRAPATYLNTNFYAQVTVPRIAARARSRSGKWWTARASSNGTTTGSTGCRRSRRHASRTRASAR